MASFTVFLFLDPLYCLLYCCENCFTAYHFGGAKYQPWSRARTPCSFCTQSDDLYETVCLGCPDPCSDCEFPKPRMVPKCSPAVKHSSSPGGTVTVEELFIDAGHWRATNKSLNIRKCLNMDACRGGLTGSKTFCGKGYEGPCEHPSEDKYI